MTEAPGRLAYRAGWRMLGRELLMQRAALVRVAAWSVPEALPALLSGLIVAHALDNGFLVRRPLTGLGWLAVLGGILAGKAVATRMSFPWLCATIEPLRDNLVRTLVHSTLQHAAGGPCRTDTSSVAQLTSQVETTRQLTAALIRTLRPLACSVIAAIAGLAVLSPVISLLVLPPVLLAFVLLRASLGTMSKRRAWMVVSAEVTAREAGAVLAGLRDVIAGGARERAAADVGAAIDAQVRATRAVARASATRIAVVALGYYVPLIGLLLAAPWLIGHARLAEGQVVGAVTYLTGSLRPALDTLAGTVGAWVIQLGAVLERLSRACAPPSPTAGQPTARPTGHEVRVRDLTFTYSATSAPVLSNLTLTLRQGEHLAIVGPSGIGKSTLAMLVAGLQSAQHGEISLGGAPLPDIPQAVLRTAFAIVPQEAYVFTGTLRENLVYLCPDATDADLDACAATIGLMPLVDRLGGYDALLGGAVPALSAGERQLIALCRVFLSPASVVILDEATCHLDPDAEARAETAFAARRGSLIVIAHRISSALRAGRILMLDGTSAQLGSHAELLDSSPLYADLAGLWNAGQP